MKLLPAQLVAEAGGHEHHEHASTSHGTTSHDHAAAGGIEWEDDMVEVNRMTTPANMRWKLIDRETGAENAAIDWRFRVGDQVKIRLLNEMAGDHPMHHPFHVHGAGRFLILSRDGVVEPNLVWKDTVLVRTGRDGGHPARRHQPRHVDGPLPHRRAPRERDDVQLQRRRVIRALSDEESPRGVFDTSPAVRGRFDPRSRFARPKRQPRRALNTSAACSVGTREPSSSTDAPMASSTSSRIRTLTR